MSSYPQDKLLQMFLIYLDTSTFESSANISERCEVAGSNVQACVKTRAINFLDQKQVRV